MTPELTLPRGASGKDVKRHSEFDVRVFNPYASTHKRQSLTSSFNANEREKKRHYNQRIVQVEHGSFTPVVFSAFGGCGRETHHFLSSLAEKLATKKNFNPSVATNWLRRKIAFALLRAQILCLRGSRTLRKVSPPSTSDMELSEWNSKALIPRALFLGEMRNISPVSFEL